MIDKTIAEKIKILFADDFDMQYNLLRGDSEAIKQLGIANQDEIAASTVLEYINNNQIEELKKQAVIKLEKRRLYHELIELYYKNTNIIQDNRKNR